MKTKRVFFDIEVTKKTGEQNEVTPPKALEIVGFANKNVVDRGNDIVDPYGIDLKNFRMNPVMLFNHDPSMPIGKVVSMEATDKGLKVKAQLSRTNEGSVKFVRELIADGTLKSFSIGFNPKEEVKNESGNNVIKSSELLEVSVVSIPMNQESTFQVVKEIDAKNYVGAKLSILKSQGCAKAAEIYEAIAGHVNDGCYRRELIKHLADELAVKSEVIDNFLAGKKKLKDEQINTLKELLDMKTKAADQGAAGDNAASVAVEGNQVKEEDANAMTQLLKQVTVLLGSVVSEIQGMSKKLDGLNDQKIEDEPKEDEIIDDEPNKDEPNEDEPKEDEPKEDEPKEDEPNEDDEFKDFRSCVDAKLAKLIEGGADKEDALREAVNACQDEKCSNNDHIKKRYIVELVKKAIDGSEVSDIKLTDSVYSGLDESLRKRVADIQSLDNVKKNVEDLDKRLKELGL